MAAVATDSHLCPECGRAFSRPQSLGAHRNRAHGVKGSSDSAKRARSERAAAARRGGAKRGGAKRKSKSRASAKRSVAKRTTARRSPTKRTTAKRAAAKRTVASGRSARKTVAARRLPSGTQRRSRKLNKEQLLMALYPSGIPISVGTAGLNRISAWLDEAEALHAFH